MVTDITNTRVAPAGASNVKISRSLTNIVCPILTLFLKSVACTRLGSATIVGTVMEEEF